MRHWVFPGNTVDVLTVAKVRQDLKGLASQPLRLRGRRGAWCLRTTCARLRREGAATSCACRCTGAGRSRGRLWAVAAAIAWWRRTFRSRRSSSATVSAGGATWCASTRARPSVSGPIAPRCWPSSRSSWHPCAHARAGRTASGPVSCGPSGRYGKYLRTGGAGRLAIDRGKVKAAERMDGKFVVYGNDDTLSAEDMALGYKQLQRVERAVASAQERAASSSGLPPRDPPHSRARGADGDRAAAGADGGARLRGDMASDPGRSEARSTCSIDWASRGRSGRLRSRARRRPSG